MILLAWKILEDSICRPTSVKKSVGLHTGYPALQEQGSNPQLFLVSLKGSRKAGVENECAKMCGRCVEVPIRA